MNSFSASEPAPPKDLSHHLSQVTRNRPFNNIKRFYQYFGIPGIGQLAGGLPANAYFPFDTLEANVAQPDRWKPTPNDPVQPPVSRKVTGQPLNSSVPASRLLVPHDSGVADGQRRVDLSSGLQYGTAQGYPPLYNFLLEFVRKYMHPNVPYAGGPDIALTVGSTDGFSKALTAFHDDWIEGRDPGSAKNGLLVEKFCYMPPVQLAMPKGMNIVSVEMDAEGLLAYGKGGLEDVLANWDFSKGRRPHLMYTVTMGQNPTSGVLSLERRREVYDVCCKYDVLIIEDDPYWYLQYPSATKNKYKLAPNMKSSGFPFLDSLVPSYLNIDTEGRVIRLDTFSKTVAPGCRLGFITAQPVFIERILRITESSTQQPSGFVQTMIAELLMGPQTPTDPGRGGAKDGSGWDYSGWVRWLEGLRGNYERRMNTMSDIFEKGSHVFKSGRRPSLTDLMADNEDNDNDNQPDDWTVIEKTPILSFTRPMGGMFLWLRMHFWTHPLFHKFTGSQLSWAFWILGTKPPYLVLSTPGSIFAPSAEIRDNLGWQHFRLCFAACPEEDVDPLSRRFVESAQAFWRIRDVEVMQGLLDEANGMGVLSADGVALEEMRGFLGPCC